MDDSQLGSDGEAVGAGAAGEMWKRVMDLYQRYKQQLRDGS